MFSVNQNRQLYVVKNWVGDAGFEVGGSALTPGDLGYATFDKNKIFFRYVGANGDVLRSDIIPLEQINYINYTAAADMIPLAKEYSVSVNSDLLTDSKVPAGKHYILRLNYKRISGISDEEFNMVFGDCYTTAAISSTVLLKRLGISLAKNLAANTTGQVLADIVFGDTPITAQTTEADLDGESGTTLTIKEKMFPWKGAGMSLAAVLPFSVSGNTVTVDGIDIPWISTTNGVVPFESAAADTVNGKLIANLEWFCAGEKGDQYRGIGWPNVVDTKYLVDPTANYDVFDISYYYQGDNEDVQHSSKVITLAVLSSAASSIKSVLSGLTVIKTDTNISE